MGPPTIPVHHLFTRSREDLHLEDRREEFEGKEDYEAMCVRLRTRLEARPSERESDRFLQLMRDRGGGNIALAWRRYFDSDGDGNLDFREFCEALIELKYKGDVPALWNELGGHMSNSLTLEALDPENAAILDFFGEWATAKMGGPLEVFKVIDSDGSDSLTADEFAEGLRGLDFFSAPDLPAGLASEEAVLSNLFPLLDQNGHGCITPGTILFLEKEAEKKEMLSRQLARIAKHGAEAAPEPLHNEAQRMLHHLAMTSTMLGGKHFKGMKSTSSLDEGFGQKRNKQRKNSLRGSQSSLSVATDTKSPKSVTGSSPGGHSSIASSPGGVSSLAKTPKSSTPCLPHIGSEPHLAPPRGGAQDIVGGKPSLVQPLPPL
mmetsp:Transcript_18501/g.60096  ORF Transcript_18501/g.60096 Transcript_18501/m.60096 type:complete len:376 (-) Transcript_18501:102-1229(-)|eukprot:CAMPEP_0203889054 /NCGR_PEP_ID=MMETSP0359-20131031/32630_1 /ASSEMBLY_ACC=CAM_ASM_000338 /TAXON_ID=268821 /ORGANISM="Scrippsiella Hangoei, Strain SHTV-5" /LENGTH=375 /DNA_ID=CAMNT_0050810375 /DNA_START=200 /DNA_END=1327 /DNA_ORIENTATION=-